MDEIIRLQMSETFDESKTRHSRIWGLISKVVNHKDGWMHGFELVGESYTAADSEEGNELPKLLLSVQSGDFNESHITAAERISANDVVQYKGVLYLSELKLEQLSQRLSERVVDCDFVCSFEPPKNIDEYFGRKRRIFDFVVEVN